MSIADKLETVMSNQNVIEEIVRTEKQNIADINACFQDKGVEIPKGTAGMEYGEYLDDVINQDCLNWTKNKTSYNGFFMSSKVSKIPMHDVSSNTNFDSTYRGMPNVVKINNVGTNPVSTIRYMCVYSPKIEEFLSPLDISDVTTASGGFYYASAFTSCTALKTIRFEGTISVPLDFRNCPLLTVESLMSIIEALEDLTGGTSQTIYLGENIAKLSASQLGLIESKNWTYQ